MGASVDTAERSAGRQAFISLKNLKIGVKIAAGFAGILAILVIVAAISVVGLSQIDEKFKASSDTSDLATVLRNIDHDFLNLRRHMREFTLTGNKQALDASNGLHQDLTKAIGKALEDIKDPPTQAKLQSVAASLAAYGDISAKFAVVRHRMDDTVANAFDTVGRRLRQETEEILDIAGNSAPINTVNMAHAIEINLLQSRLNGFRMLVKHDQASTDYAQKYIDNLKASVAALTAVAMNDALRTRLQNLNANAKKFEAAFQSIARDLMEIEGPLMTAATETGTSITSQIDAIVTAITTEEKHLDEATHAQIASSERLAVILTIFSLLAGGGLAWFIGAAISTPVRQMTRSMESLAAGNLNIDITRQHRKDEIGAMARALAIFRDAAVAKIRRDEEVEEERRRGQEERARLAEEAIQREREIVTASIGAGLARLSEKDLTYRMTSDVPEAYLQLQSDFNTAMTQLEEALTSVSTTSNSVYTGTKEIAAAAGDLSRRTEQQAASLEETAAALDEITASIKQSADGAKQAREAVATARADAEKSGDVVRRAVEAMGGIDASSKQISQIIGVIDEIAFQTNLLALNAGVEAARAGDAGRGFAVVASEVRALAQRSAEAAKEIEGLIINSTTQVRDGVVLVGETGKSLERIVGQVAEINTLIEGIASSAQEQAGSLQQINSAANQMDQTTQQNAAMAEEATAASLTLSRRSEELTALIGQFSLGGGEGLRAELMKTAPHAFRQRAASASGERSTAARRQAAAGAGGQWSEF